MIQKIYEYLTFSCKSIKWYHYPLEWLVYRYYWNKVILPELIENDAIFEWFEKNNFQLVQKTFTGSYLKTMERCSDFPIIMGRAMKEQELYIFKDYWASFSNVLDTNASFDLQNHLKIRVEIDDTPFQSLKEDKILHERIFTVFIEFTRRQYIDKICKPFFTRFFIILSIIMVLIIFIAYYGYKH